MWALQGGRVAIAAQALGIGDAAIAEAIAFAKAAAHLRAADRELPSHPVDAGRRGHRARGGAHADLEGGNGQGHAGADPPGGVDGQAGGVGSGPQAADRAMQILASEGYRRGSLVERLFRDVRATEIYQGTSEAQRMIIAQETITDG